MWKDVFAEMKSSLKTWGAYGIALAAGVIYLIQALDIARRTVSILDEGAYLLKGYLFITGQYTPYQPYGPWTNKMPVSFLIPGAIQNIFGPDLGVGRYFAILLGLLMLLGLWILANRLAGKWWAAGIVAFFALNPGIISDYSQAVSQILVACMLTWMLVLVVGKNQKTWQIALGALLAGLIVMTRINLFFILPFTALYLYWEHGKRIALTAVIGMLIPVLVGHALYWPDILHRYAVLFPRSITPFLDPWRTAEPYSSLWDPEPDTGDRLLSLLQAARIQFVPIAGALISWLLWPSKNKWQDQADYRAAIYLSALFISLLLFHIWAALGNDFCIYCFSGYLSFFSFIGLIILALTHRYWRRKIPAWLQVALFILVILFAVSAGYGSFPEIGNQTLETKVPATLEDFPDIEWIRLRKYLRVEHKIIASQARRQVPALLGLGAGILVAILGYELWYRRSRHSKSTAQNDAPHTSYGYWLLTAFLLVGMLAAPVVYYYPQIGTGLCSGDVLKANRTAGKHLAALIPPGSRVYWDGGGSTAPLLYVPDIEIYPPQINGAYSFKVGAQDDPDSLLRLGYWNAVLDQAWQREADFVLVQDHNLTGNLQTYLLDSGDFVEMESTSPTNPCDESTRIRVFMRIH